MVVGGLSGGVVENGSRACKNPWRLARGKRFPARFCWLLWGEVYPAVRRGPWRRIPEADIGRQVAGGQPRTLGCTGSAVESVQGLSWRVDTLSSSPMRSVK